MPRPRTGYLDARGDGKFRAVLTVGSIGSKKRVRVPLVSTTRQDAEAELAQLVADNQPQPPGGSLDMGPRAVLVNRWVTTQLPHLTSSEIEALLAEWAAHPGAADPVVTLESKWLARVDTEEFHQQFGKIAVDHVLPALRGGAATTLEVVGDSKGMTGTGIREALAWAENVGLLAWDGDRWSLIR